VLPYKSVVCGMSFKTILVHCFKNTSRAWPQVADRPAGSQAVDPATGYPFSVARRESLPCHDLNEQC
jgi:hypothetical protein